AARRTSAVRWPPASACTSPSRSFPRRSRRRSPRCSRHADSSCRLPVSRRRLPVAGFQSPACPAVALAKAGCRSPVAGRRRRVARYLWPVQSLSAQMIGLPLFHELFDSLPVVHALLENLPGQRWQLAVAREAQCDELSGGELVDPRLEVWRQELAHAQPHLETDHTVLHPQRE